MRWLPRSSLVALGEVAGPDFFSLGGPGVLVPSPCSGLLTSEGNSVSPPSAVVVTKPSQRGWAAAGCGEQVMWRPGKSLNFRLSHYCLLFRLKL